MSCDNQISTQDLINAKDDATTLGEVATSRAGAESGGAPITQSTNRFGEVTDTVQGRLNKMGVLYDDPIRDWSPSLLVDDLRAHRYPATTGDIYIPVKPIPFTTDGTFNTSDWELYQGLTPQQIDERIINDLSQAYDFSSIEEARDSAIVFPVGKVITIDAATWGVVLTSSVTPNADNVVQSSVNPLLSFKQLNHGQYLGEIDRKYSMVSGVVRNSGGGWFIIDDTSHRNSNIASVQAMPDGSLQVDYAKEYDKIVSMNATPDEDLAKRGIMMGGSVGKGAAFFQLAAAIKLYVDSSDGSITTDPIFAPYVSADVSTQSEIVINHPAMIGPPTITALGGEGRPRGKVSFNSTQTIIQEMTTISGYFQYNGASWDYFGDMAGAPTAAFAGGILTITHAEAYDNVSVNLTGRDGILVQAGSTGTTTIQVKFYDIVTGAQIMTEDTSMKFHFARNGRVLAKSVGGLYTVHLGVCKLDANDFVSSSGNIWLHGEFENDSAEG